MVAPVVYGVAALVRILGPKAYKLGKEAYQAYKKANLKRRVRIGTDKNGKPIFKSLKKKELISEGQFLTNRANALQKKLKTQKKDKFEVKNKTKIKDKEERKIVPQSNTHTTTDAAGKKITMPDKAPSGQGFSGEATKVGTSKSKESLLNPGAFKLSSKNFRIKKAQGKEKRRK